MIVKYIKRFLKGLSKVPLPQRQKIEVLVFSTLNEAFDLSGIPNTKKLSKDPYYRIRVGNYRIGLEKHEDHILLRRVLNRKDIYKYFP